MNIYLSNKLRFVSFTCIILVVFLHGYTIVFNFGSGISHDNSAINYFIQTFICDGLARVAVPAFFTISGFLFFNNFQFSISAFLQKLRKRIKTLAIPFLLWSLYSLLLFWILQRFTISRPFFANRLIENYSFTQLLNIVILNPLAYQLWFLKDLFFLVLLSPLLYLLIKRLPIFSIAFASIIWILRIKLVILDNISLLFFVIGGVFAYYPIHYLIKGKILISIFIFSWIVLCLFHSYLIVNNITYFSINLIQNVSILTGMVGLWSLYDILMGKNKLPTKRWLNLFSYSFFIFCFHEPLLTILRKSIFHFSDKSSLSIFLIFWICPILTIGVSIIVAKVLNRFIPTFYNLITGGR